MVLEAVETETVMALVLMQLLIQAVAVAVLDQVVTVGLVVLVL